MSLWEEHLGKEAVRRPESRRCVGLVNGIATDNWRRYAADDDGKGPLQCTSEPTAGWSRCQGTSCSRTLAGGSSALPTICRIT
jgi:hypothetical protein